MDSAVRSTPADGSPRPAVIVVGIDVSAVGVSE
jgi:hypothetical protein